jgi:hypothetical protein
VRLLQESKFESGNLSQMICYLRCTKRDAEPRSSLPRLLANGCRWTKLWNWREHRAEDFAGFARLGSGAEVVADGRRTLMRLEKKVGAERRRESEEAENLREY